jgi:hypothetical protein
MNVLKRTTSFEYKIAPVIAWQRCTVENVISWTNYYEKRSKGYLVSDLPLRLSAKMRGLKWGHAGSFRIGGKHTQ